MPRYWTRKLELELIDFVRARQAIWKPLGNTNHDIQLKYKAYAEFAAKIGQGFTARAVRDRWVNIRSTFNYNLRKVKKTEQGASNSQVYVPCWPLWKPLQFLREDLIKEEMTEEHQPLDNLNPKEEPSELDLQKLFVRTDRPRHRKKIKKKKSNKCVKIMDNLIEALNPLVKRPPRPRYWFFGKHVAEQLDCMTDADAESASKQILRLIRDWTQVTEFT